MWDNAILFSLCEKNLPIKIVVRKFGAVEVERMWKSGKVNLWMMNCAIFIVYTRTNFFEDPLTSNNAKNRDSLNEETFANAKLSGFFLYTDAISNR